MKGKQIIKLIDKMIKDGGHTDNDEDDLFGSGWDCALESLKMNIKELKEKPETRIKKSLSKLRSRN